MTEAVILAISVPPGSLNAVVRAPATCDLVLLLYAPCMHPGPKSQLTVDLHGLRVTEAVSVVASILDSRSTQVAYDVTLLS